MWYSIKDIHPSSEVIKKLGHLNIKEIRNINVNKVVEGFKIKDGIVEEFTFISEIFKRSNKTRRLGV